MKQEHSKSCQLCLHKVEHVDYKDAKALARYLTEQGKIVSRRQTGNCAEHQRQITIAIKRSRQIGFVENN